MISVLTRLKVEEADTQASRCVPIHPSGIYMGLTRNQLSQQHLYASPYYTLTLLVFQYQRAKATLIQVQVKCPHQTSWAVPYQTHYWFIINNHISGLPRWPLVVKNLPAHGRDVRARGWTPGLRRSPGGGYGNPLQYSSLENPMDRGVWRVTVHGVTQSRTWLKWLSTHAHTQISTWKLNTLCSTGLNSPSWEVAGFRKVVSLVPFHADLCSWDPSLFYLTSEIKQGSVCQGVVAV